MSLTLAPDTLGLVIAWLQAQTELSALVSTRVMSRLPKSKTFPLVRITRIGGTEVHGHNHWLHDPMVQVDCFAKTEQSAFDVARVASALLSQRFDGLVTAGGISAVISDATLGGIHQGFDTVDPDLPVARFDAQFRVHPA